MHPSPVRLAKAQLLSAMVIFGTIGLLVRAIPLPSGVIALARGAVGSVFLLILSLAKGGLPTPGALRANGWVLALSGAALGGNWILLFEAYRHTTVAVATLCYYLAPVFVILISPLVLRETLTGRKLLCCGAALGGMALVSGVFSGSGAPSAAGIALGVGAAGLYACVVLLNKCIRGIPSFGRTLAQLIIASAVLAPYTYFTCRGTAMVWTGKTLALLAVAGIVHTGAAYALYFASMPALPAQTLALFSYLDPVVAILLSALVLRERMDGLSLLGAALVLGSTLFSELGGPKKAEDAAGAKP